MNKHERKQRRQRRCDFAAMSDQIKREIIEKRLKRHRDWYDSHEITPDYSKITDESSLSEAILTEIGKLKHDASLKRLENEREGA